MRNRQGIALSPIITSASLCYRGELIYFLPALPTADSSTFPYKLSLQLLRAEFAVVRVNRPRKLRSETENGGTKGTLERVP